MAGSEKRMSIAATVPVWILNGCAVNKTFEACKALHPT